MFPHDDVTRTFLHGTQTRCSHGKGYCEECTEFKKIVAFGTGFLLRSLYDRKERKLAGSNVVGIEQGEISANTAAIITEKTKYVKSLSGAREEVDFSMSVQLLLKSMVRDFPGVDIVRDMGADTPLHYGNYTISLIYGDVSYGSLSTVYKIACGYEKNNKLDDITLFSFVLLTFHLNNFFNINPNAIWSLWANNIERDLIAGLSVL